jgi:hypothetical protein
MRRCFAAASSVALFCSAAASLLPFAAAEPTRIYWSDGDGLWRAPLEDPLVRHQIPAFEVRGIAVAEDRLVWSDAEPRVPVVSTGVIRSADHNGAGVHDVATELPQPSGVALHTPTNTVYWSDLQRNAIYRRSLDGTGPVEEVLGGMAGVAAIHSIAVQPREQRLYFGFVNPLIDGLFPGSIARMNLDGTEFETVVSGLIEPWGVAVDSIAGIVYWTDAPLSGPGMIGRAPSDGGDIEELVGGLMAPRGIALDLDAASIYWADAGAGKIQRAGLDGRDFVDVLTGLPEPRAVALFSIPEPGTVSLVMMGVALLMVSRSGDWLNFRKSRNKLCLSPSRNGVGILFFCGGRAAELPWDALFGSPIRRTDPHA